jgi:hypothetical protein
MKYLKKYINFKESVLVDLNIQSVADILESLTIWTDSLLEAIGAEEVDIYDTFKLPIEDYKDKLDLDYLEDNVEFINSLSSIALKKSEVKLSDDYQTFLNKPCRFMFIYDINSNELENASYLIFQSWNDTLNKWEDIKLYKIHENTQRFYDKLSSRTLELVDGGDKYIYQTSNGNEWVLQNSEKENDAYKKVFRKEELENFLKNNKVKVNIL